MSQNTGIGGNSGFTKDELAEMHSEADKARKFIYIIGELNRAAADKRALSETEKEIKTALKGNGIPPKALAIARRVKADPKGEEAYSVASRIIHEGLAAEELESLDELKEERREISVREKDLRAAAIEAGINIDALKSVRQMQNMDPVEREEYFDAMVAYPKWLKFW